jgi:hypothetical protein
MCSQSVRHFVLPSIHDSRPPPKTLGFRPRMENELVKRLMFSALLAGLGALASIATTKSAAIIWRRLFDEEPPE